MTIAIWQVFSWLGIFNPIYFASPIEVLSELGSMISGGVFPDMFASLWRVIISVLAAAAVGIPIGILFGYLSNLYKLFGGVVDFFRSIPPIVFYPLFLISLGVGDESRIAVAFLGALVVIILIISKGLMQESSLRRNYFRSLGAPRMNVLRDVVWFEALPHVFTALRTSTSLVVIIVIVTEMLVGSQFGLGVRVQNVQITSNIPDLFATIIIIGLIGVVLNKILIYLENKYVFWKSN